MNADKLFIFLQHVLPKHFLSRLVGLLTNCKYPQFKNWSIDKFIRDYQVNMDEALESNPHSYATFNEFFTRALKPGVRPIAQEADAIACPVDGSISQIGVIHNGQLIQAKGFNYSLQPLLGGSIQHAATFQNGQFITLYLAPKDYHRVHMPLAGKLLEMIHVPGQLFSVNPLTVNNIPNLFARNERVIALFETIAGKMAVILVGATLVASISTVWSGIVTPAARQVQHWNYETSSVVLEKGAELGHFQLGSTVIVLFESHRMEWLPALQSTQAVQMGQLLGRIRV